MTETTTEKDNRSEQQARCQLEGIREMVAALSRETAAAAYSMTIDRAACAELLEGAGIQCYDSETLEELREAVAVNIEDGTIEPEDFEFDEDAAREAIQEDPLSVEVRSGWSQPGVLEAEEYMILLCTGGPAVRIVGDLGQRGEPSTASIEHQDWFTKWESISMTEEEERDVLTYARQFYFGD